LARKEVELEKKKTESIKAAFASDRKALTEKVDLLEETLSYKRKEFEELSSQLSTRNDTDSMQRNELNFWNGKVTNMRRDLEMQQGFN
jgi:chromosome segregation ATPase